MNGYEIENKYTSFSTVVKTQIKE